MTTDQFVARRGRPRGAHRVAICWRAPQAFADRIRREKEERGDRYLHQTLDRSMAHLWSSLGERDEVVEYLHGELAASQQRVRDLEAVAAQTMRREAQLVRELEEVRARLRQVDTSRRRRSLKNQLRKQDEPRPEGPLYSVDVVHEAERTPCTAGCGSMVDAYAVSVGDLRCPPCRHAAGAKADGRTPTQGL